MFSATGSDALLDSPPPKTAFARASLTIRAEILAGEQVRRNEVTMPRLSSFLTSSIISDDRTIISDVSTVISDEVPSSLTNFIISDVSTVISDVSTVISDEGAIELA